MSISGPNDGAPCPMPDYSYHAELWLPRPRSEVFAFFSDAFNLQELTPSWLSFEVLTPRPITMKPGTLIDYRLRVHGLPLRWRTRITEWEPEERFVDEQLRGPYHLWHHTHRFEDSRGGTLCIDDVRYRPIGGALAYHLFVRRDVEKIFEFRRQRLTQRFPAGQPTLA